jgi:hypothetical protein
MTLRVALMTSGPVGGAGVVLDRLTRVPEVEFVCLIVSQTILAKRSRKKMLQKKSGRSAPSVHSTGCVSANGSVTA